MKKARKQYEALKKVLDKCGIYYHTLEDKKRGLYQISIENVLNIYDENTQTMDTLFDIPTSIMFAEKWETPSISTDTIMENCDNLQFIEDLNKNT